MWKSTSKGVQNLLGGHIAAEIAKPAFDQSDGRATAARTLLCMAGEKRDAKEGADPNSRPNPPMEAIRWTC
jgi:hypothetical protein